MGIFSILKVYDKKMLNKNIGIFLFCLFTMSISITAVISIQLLNNIYEKSVQNNIAICNGGDINVFSDINNLDSEQKMFFEKIVEDNRAKVELFSKRTVNILANNEIDSTILYYRSAIRDKRNNPENNISINKSFANRLRIKQGDTILVKTDEGIKKFKIEQLIDGTDGLPIFDNEVELMEEILGSLHINVKYGEYLGKYNGAFINVINKNDIETIKNEIIDVCGDKFNVRTEKDLQDNTKNRITFQMQLLNLIGIFAYIVCGISMSFTFYVLNMKRERDIAIFKIFGMDKKDIILLSIVETTIVALTTCVIATPLGVFFYKYLSNIFLGENISMSFTMLKELGRILSFILMGMFIFSFIPIDIISNVPLIKVFRNRKIAVGKELKKYGSLGVVFIISSIISCLIIKSFYGIVLTSIIMILAIVFVLILSSIYWIMSKIKIIFRNIFYLVFKELDFNKAFTAIISVSFILGVSLILIFLNLNSNLIENTNTSRTRTSSQIVNISVNEEKKVDDILLSKEKKDFEKYYINSGEIESINGYRVENIIKDRFRTSQELRKNYRDYVKNLQIFELDYRCKIPSFGSKIKSGKNNEKQIIINTDFFNMIHKFEVNDEIVIKFGDVSERFIVSEILSSSKTNNSDAFGFVIYNDKNKNRNENISDIVYKFDNINSKIYKVFREVPSAYIYDTSKLSLYTEKFINKYRGIFVYSVILIIIAGIFFMFNGSYVSMKRKMKNISIYYSMGATLKAIHKIYFTEAIIFAIINSFIAIIISTFVSKFVIEIMAQKTYNFNVYMNIAFVVLSIIINSIIYWNLINKFDNAKMNNLLRE